MNTEEQSYGIPSAAIPHRAARLGGQQPLHGGALLYVWRWFVGSPDPAKRDIRAATSHGAFIALLARIWSFPLMLFFSLGALVTLGSQPISHNIALLQTGHAPDWVEVAGLAVTVAFVIGMDLAMITAATHIRDARAHGARVTQFWFDAVIVLLVGGIETWTFFQMVAGSQKVPLVAHPTALYETIFIGYRAVLVPVVAIYLAIVRPRTATRQDIEQLLRIKVATGCCHISNGQYKWVTQR